ncbi:MAG: pilus assembly protein TadG-related protein [Asticcacaulis sp.]|uniref:pilus assembly protein TadG-related protein n=1 Tax=Asticcacaulis sp. TaxID=1872648 RepID=UPI0039E36A24
MSAKSGFWNRFREHKGGNVAIIFGLSALFLVMITGGAVDFSRLNDARNKMQDAADVAVLRGALTTSQGDTAASSAANEAFAENFSDDDVTITTRSLGKTVVGNVSKLSYSATGTVKPIFIGSIIGATQTITVNSVAQSEVNPFELALVLDVTGSMNSSSKLTYLKSSVTAVLNSLLDSSGNNSSNVKVGVVPFNTQVRLTPSSSYSYVDYSKCAETESNNTHTAGTPSGVYYSCLAAYKVYNSICASASSANQSSCLSLAAAKMFYKVNTSTGVYSATAITYVSSVTYTNSATATVNATTGTVTYSVGTPTATTYVATTTTTTSGRKTTTTTTSAADNAKAAYTSYSPSGYTAFASTPIFSTYASTWAGSSGGCVMDRGQSYDVSATAYTAGVLDSAYQATDCDNSTLSAIQDLTTSISTTKTYVNNLVAAGNTNITIGVQMGMEVLSPDAPYTQGVAWGDEDMDKYMIIVTDGDNTANRWTPSSASSSLIDARTALACQAAKDKGITIFVVRVMDGNSDMLKACATKTIYYYDLSSASQLTTAMADIFQRIGKLRLVQ